MLGHVPWFCTWPECNLHVAVEKILGSRFLRSQTSGKSKIGRPLFSQLNFAEHLIPNSWTNIVPTYMLTLTIHKSYNNSTSTLVRPTRWLETKRKVKMPMWPANCCKLKLAQVIEAKKYFVIRLFLVASE